MKTAVSFPNLLLLLGFLVCLSSSPDVRAAGYAHAPTSFNVEAGNLKTLSSSTQVLERKSGKVAVFWRKALNAKLQHFVSTPAFRKLNAIRQVVDRKLALFLPDVVGRADKEAIWALGLGIGSVFILPLLGPAALYLGICALEDGSTRRTEATIGIVLGAASTLVLLALIALLVSISL